MKAIAVGFVFSAVVSVALALSGAGAYSFVLGTLVQSLVVAVLVLRIARVPFRLGFDRTVARRLLVFGIPLAAGLGIESVLLYSDSMIVGHVLGTVVLGFYLLAFNISSWVPGMVGAAVRYVSIPAFSRLAEGETDDVRPRGAAGPAPAGRVRGSRRRRDGGAVARADPRPVRRPLGAGRRRPALPGLRDGRADVHGAGLRHPDGPGQHPGDGLAEPRLAGRPAARAVDRRAPRAACAAPPSVTPSSPSSWPSRWPGGCCTAPVSHMRPVLRGLVRPVLAAMARRVSTMARARRDRLTRPFVAAGDRRWRSACLVYVSLALPAEARARALAPGDSFLAARSGGARHEPAADSAPLVSIALPVYNGADTVAPVDRVRPRAEPPRPGARDQRQRLDRRDRRRSAGTSRARTDGSSTCGTPTNIGLLNNFVSAAAAQPGRICGGSGTTTRSSPSYVSRALEVFAEDERRVLVTTQIVYTDADGVETLDTDYDPTALSSPDPVERLRSDAPPADQRFRARRPALRA